MCACFLVFFQEIGDLGVTSGRGGGGGYWARERGLGFLRY